MSEGRTTLSNQVMALAQLNTMSIVRGILVNDLACREFTARLLRVTFGF